MAILLQRVCPNDRFWTGPSPGRAGTDSAYPGERGFGHEDWNFNRDDAIDGWVYGYIYSVPKRFETNLGPHEVYFWVLDPKDSNRRLLVGYYGAAEFVSRAEAKKIAAVMERRGILRRRSAELAAALYQSRGAITVDSLERTLMVEGGFRLRTPPNEIVVLSQPEPMDPSRRWGVDLSLDRYYSHPQEVRTPTRGQLPARGPSSSDGAGTHPPSSLDLPEESYERYSAATRQLIVPLHSALSNAFAALLRSLGDKSPKRAGVLDMVLNLDGESWMFELKVAYGGDTRHAIREAVGQIAEYSLHPDVRKSLRAAISDDTRRCIVLDCEPSQSDLEYLVRLNSQGFRVGLIWRKGTRFGRACLGQTLLEKGLANQAQ